MSTVTPPIENNPAIAKMLAADRAWDEAFLRVESYLRAHHLESRVLLNQIATDTIRAARDRVRTDPAEEPVAAAMQVMHERMGEWFARAGRAGDWSEERVRAAGRLALVLADLPGRWADCFLSAGPVPWPLVQALEAGVLQPGPELRSSKMSAVPLEFSFDRPDDQKFFRNGRWVGLRAAAAWLFIMGIYGAAWASAH